MPLKDPIKRAEYKHQWHLAHKDERAENARKRYAARKDDIVCREEDDAYRKKYRDIHREERLAYTREWKKKHPGYSLRWKETKATYYKNHKEQCDSSTRKSHELHREKRVINNRARRARMLGSDGNFTPEEWQGLLDKYNHKCLCCGKTNINLTVDHVLPIAKGGSNYISNIQPLCRSCNCKKHANYADYRQEYFSDWT